MRDRERGCVTRRTMATQSNALCSKLERATQVDAGEIKSLDRSVAAIRVRSRPNTEQDTEINMWLMIYYTVLSVLGAAIAAALCVAIEQLIPWLSLPLFFTLLALVLWGAWRLAIWLTRGEETRQPAEEPNSPARSA